MSTRARASAAAGFTLIEVVLALAIFGLIAVLLYGTFFVGQRAVVKGEHEAEMNQRMRTAEDLIGRQLRSAVFYFAHNEDENVPYFIGRVDGVSFVSAAPQSRGGTGLAVVTYRVVGRSLVLEERAAFTPDDLYDPPRDALVENAVVLSDLTTIRFDYLAHDDTAGAWQPNWDAREEDMMPAAVRLTIEGLDFLGGVPWVRQVPLMTIAYGWGNEEFQEPPDDEEEDDGGLDAEDAGNDSDADDDGDDE